MEPPQESCPVCPILTQDIRHGKQLEAHFRKLHGRPVPFADILRRLLAEKVAALEARSQPLAESGSRDYSN